MAAPIAVPERVGAPPDDTEPTHVVCICRVDAAPRLALCGADCSGEAHGITPTPCVVCLDLLRPFLEAGARCDRCRP